MFLLRIHQRIKPIGRKFICSFPGSAGVFTCRWNPVPSLQHVRSPGMRRAGTKLIVNPSLSSPQECPLGCKQEPAKLSSIRVGRRIEARYGLDKSGGGDTGGSLSGNKLDGNAALPEPLFPGHEKHRFADSPVADQPHAAPLIEGGFQTAEHAGAAKTVLRARRPRAEGVRLLERRGDTERPRDASLFALAIEAVVIEPMAAIRGEGAEAPQRLNGAEVRIQLQAHEQ